MREKKLSAIFTFYTTAAAMLTEKICREQKLPGKLIPAPRAVTADCGMAWKAPAEARKSIEQAEGMPEFEGIYEMMV